MHKIGLVILGFSILFLFSGCSVFLNRSTVVIYNDLEESVTVSINYDDFQDVKIIGETERGIKSYDEEEWYLQWEGTKSLWIDIYVDGEYYDYYELYGDEYAYIDIMNDSTTGYYYSD